MFADVATILISLLALGASAVSLRYARSSATAAKTSAQEAARVAGIEARRHHQERTPRLDVSVEDVQPGSWSRLVVLLRSHEPLSTLRVQVVDGASLHFTADQEGVLFAGDEATHNRQLEPLKRDAAWRVDFDDADRERTIAMRVTATIEGEEWILPLEVKLPPPRPRIAAASFDR